MTKIKRTFSALLAVVMVFTTMAIAFTVIGSAAPTVPRTATTVLSPSVIFTVPPYLITYGSDDNQGGNNVKAEGQIQATVTSTNTAAVENISLTCSDAGVQLSPRSQATTGESTWTIQGGTVKTPAASDGTTVVKWTLSYTVAGKGYTTYAWSQVRPRINDPGFAVYVRHKNSLSYETHNHHVEWIGPVMGDPATNTVSNFYQCYVKQGQGNHEEATGRYASSYYWNWDQGSGDDEKHTSGTTATGTLYADYSQVTTLGEIGLASVAKTHALLADPGNRPQKYLGTEITGQYYQGAQADGVYSVTNTGSGSVAVGSGRGDVFSGPLPPVGANGGTAQINATIHWEGNVETDVLHWQHSYHDTYCKYQINIVTYNKSALWTAISTAMDNNYQQSQFRNENPGTSSRFRSWDQYLEALQNAWYIYGREDVTQSAIDDAVTQLTQATPKYDANTGAWISGMMYADADYSGIESIFSTISQTLDNPDFFVKYADGVYGKYYQYSLAAALIDAIDDIKIEYNLEHDETLNKTPLDARYQAVVDQMRINLNNAVNALIETPQRQTSKLMSVEFVANEAGVTNVPQPITTSLTGEIARPTTNPSKNYYRFTGWYYDAEATEPVEQWPLYFDPSSPYFKADLEDKVDNAGVAYTLYAGWQITGKTLEFDTQGGSEIPMAIGNNGDPYSGPTETPTKAGCRFLGWYTDDSLETPVNWSTFTFGSLSVVYAKWTADTFTVTFNANGGTFSGGSDTFTVTDLFGSPVAEPTPPTQTGVGFNGWYYDSALTQPVDISNFTIPSSNMQLYAKWSEDVRNVFFYPENGDEPVFLTVDVGSRVERPVDPEKEGFTFKGWYGNPRGTGSPRTFPINIGGSNVTLFAIYTPLKFTITFDPGDGVMASGFNASAYRNLDCGSTITPPPVPTKTDYVFSTWMLDGEPYELTTVPACDITLVASYVEEPYTATFRLRTDVTDTDTVSQGDIITATVSIQANRYVANHRFVVYYDKRYLTPALNGVEVKSAISGTAACSSTPNKAYFTLINNAGGNVWSCGTPTGRVKAGIAPTSQYFPADWAVDNRTLKDEYSNYEFVYYEGPDVSTGTRVRPNGEVDIASFQFLVLPTAPLADGVTSYAQLFMSPDFIRTPEVTGGKIGACLQADATYTNMKDWDKTTNNIVDYDHRFAVNQMKICNINYVTNGGAVLDPDSVKQGGTVQLKTPTRDYYDFAGWTLTNNADDTEYVSISAFQVPMQDSITLYAKWIGKQVNYYVRHHKQNTTASGFLDNYEQQTIKAAVGTTVTATAKDYAGFVCSNPNMSGVVRGETANPLILDLYYLRKTTNITLDTNGGKFQNQQQTMVLSGLFDTAVTNIPENPTREGYTFTGWENGDVPYTINKYPANDVTLTAKWTAKTIMVRFFLGENTTPFSTLYGKYGDPIEAPTDVNVPDGYLFTGWKNAAGTPFSYTTFPAENEDFYGSVVVDADLLTLVINGQPYNDPIEIRRGTQVTEESIGYTPAPGYRFTGWRTENSKDGALAQFPMTLTGDTTLYGFTEHIVYSIQTVIYFDGEPEDGPSVNNLFYGSTFDLPEPDDYTDIGYGFRGWYTDEEMTTLYQKPETMPAQNLLLYGEYYLMTGTIQFNLNGGTGTAPADITRQVNTTVNLPGNTGFSRKYYTFGGWSSSPTGTTPVTRYTIIGEDPVTMYAIWKINYMTISFNLNGAEYGTRPENMQIEVGETITAANLPQGLDFSKTGYIFAGWADKANATAALESFTATNTNSKTFYAVWIADTVTLVAREGSTTVIDDERGFIYGLDFGVTEQALRDSFLDVVGNGHIEFESAMIGTGTVVNVINDYTGNVDATYEIVIFGDLNGDGILNSSDVTELRNVSARIASYEPDSAQFFAADITHDGNINSSDVTEIRNANARISTVAQTIEEE